MFFFILQTLFLALLASLIGYFLGRFLKKLFCKNNTTTEVRDTAYTQVNTASSKAEKQTSTLNKAAVVATAGAGAAAVAQALSDRETGKSSYSSDDVGADAKINIDDEVSSAVEAIEVEVTEGSKISTKETEEKRSNLADAEILNTTNEIENELEVTADNTKDDGFLIDVAKAAAATIATGVAVKAGAAVLDDNNDSIEIDETVEGLEDLIEDTELAEEVSLEDDISDVAELAEEVGLEDDISENAEIETGDIEDSINELEDEIIAKTEVEDSELLEDTIESKTVEAIEDLGTIDEDYASLLDVEKVAAATIATGVATKVGADILSNEDDESTEANDMENIESAIDEEVVESESINSPINEEDEATEADLSAQSTDATDDDTTETDDIDSIESSTEDVAIEETEANTDEDAEATNDTNENGLLDTLKTVATVAGAGIAAKASATALDNSDDTNSNNSEEKSSEATNPATSSSSATVDGSVKVLNPSRRRRTTRVHQRSRRSRR